MRVPPALQPIIDTRSPSTLHLHANFSEIVVEFSLDVSVSVETTLSHLFRGREPVFAFGLARGRK